MNHCEKDATTILVRVGLVTCLMLWLLLASGAPTIASAQTSGGDQYAPPEQPGGPTDPADPPQEPAPEGPAPEEPAPDESPTDNFGFPEAEEPPKEPAPEPEPAKEEPVSAEAPEPVEAEEQAVSEAQEVSPAQAPEPVDEAEPVAELVAEPVAEPVAGAVAAAEVPPEVAAAISEPPVSQDETDLPYTGGLELAPEWPLVAGVFGCVAGTAGWLVTWRRLNTRNTD